MRFRLGAFIGFGAGYYYGAKAGRERYVQLNRTIRRIRRSSTVDQATDKARAVIDLTMERARDLVESRTGGGNGADLPTDPASPYLG